MNKPFDVITFSDMCVDLIISGRDVVPQFGQVEKLVEDYTLELGGSCNIFACQAAKLGLHTAVLGRVGDDSFGRLILQRLQDCGVDTRYVIVDPSLKTGIGVALCPPGDRAILTYMGTINAVFPEDITPDILASTRHIHHGSHYLHTNLLPGISAIFKQARGLGLSTSLDPNWDPAERWDGELSKILPDTELFFPNDQEALHISRTERLETAAQYFLNLGVQMVAIKAGIQGSHVYTPQATLSQSVTPVSGGDSIGAGDSFDAGFLAGWLRGYPLEKCLDIATRCGRSVASQIGGLAGQPAWEDLNDMAIN
ncbi:MAG: sugar kinase [Anaerolineaceae bacterium]|nr:sugar kinase [Anaerolineaceae bacterium]